MMDVRERAWPAGLVRLLVVVEEVGRETREWRVRVMREDGRLGSSSRSSWSLLASSPSWDFT